MKQLDVSLQQSEGDSNNSPKRTAWQQNQTAPNTELLNRDSEIFLHQSLSTPCLSTLKSAKGPFIYDHSDRPIYDFHGNSVHQVGFGHPHIIAALQAQLTNLPFCTRRYTNNVAVDFAEKLISNCPDPLSKLLLCPSGTGAIGMALKLARLHTGKYKTISMWHSFHGASLDAISIGGERLFRDQMGPLLPGSLHVDPVEADGNDEKSLYQINQLFENHTDIGAVIAEPIRWSTVTIPKPSYWQEVRRLCNKHDALLIFDEIGTGLGRTGKWFAFEHFGITPDILVLGKGLGGGVMPLAAMIACEELNIGSDRALGHYTHEKNPMSCAAGLATLEVIENENLVQSAKNNGQYFLEQLSKLKEQYPIIRDVRGFGMLIGVEITEASIAEQIMYDALDAGINLKISDGNVLTLVPALTITKDQLDEAITILRKVIAPLSL